jgi:hypothetical protein
MTEQRFRAGVGRVVINPPITAVHAGWGAQLHVVPDGIEADLWVTVLAVDDGENGGAFVDIDLVIVSREESDAIREAVGTVLGIPASAVRCSLTHNHAGVPGSSWDWLPEGIADLKAYYEYLPTAAASAARMALLDKKPARIGVGYGESHVAVNRRETSPTGRTVTGTNFGGEIDPQVQVTRIDSLDGDSIAAIVGYTMHPTTMGPTNRLFSPDWPGHMKRTVEQITGATCFFAQGATGDIGPGPDGFTDDLKVIRRIGAQVGCEAARVWFGLTLPAVSYHHERVWESGAPLGKWRSEPLPEEPVTVQSITTTVSLPLLPQVPVAEAKAALAKATAEFDRLREAGAPASEVEAATFVLKRANMTLSRSEWFDGKSEFPADLQILKIGPVVFAGTELEPFSWIGKSVKSRSPFPNTWFGGYTGGWFGYVPTADAYPKRGYEVDTSPYTPEAAEALADQVVAALEGLASGN